jgi:hypothetical protein
MYLWYFLIQVLVKGEKMNKVLWYVKQLFPMTYYTTYGVDDKQYFSIWKMWFGKCFHEVKFQIVKGE